MNNEHPISDEVLDIATIALSKGHNWMAYNNSLYLIDMEDIHFFRNEETAKEFARDNISDRDRFCVIRFDSIQDILKEIPYGEWMNRVAHDPDTNGLYNKDGNAFTDALIEQIEQQQLLNSQLKTYVMNEKNLTYLKDNIKYMGFGENLYSELENQLSKGASEFSLAFKTEVNKKNLEATLHFKKSDSTDMYFFNKYDVRTATEKKDETMAQTFYLNKGQGVTLKEAYNLLNGRAVSKELIDKNDQKYQAWIQMDFGVKDKNGNFKREQYHQNYGYDLKEVLSYYPIKEMMKEEEKEKLVRSLEKGNVQSVTLETPDKDVKVFIEANPQYKTINLYNNKMQNLSQDQRQELMQKPEIKDHKLEKENKQELSKEGQPEKKQGKAGKKMAGEDGLLPKKRASNKKGLSV